MTDETAKKLQVQIDDDSLKMLPDLPADAAQELLAHVLTTLDTAQKDAAPSSAEMEGHIQGLQDMAALMAQAQAAEAAGDTKLLAALSRKISQAAGTNRAPAPHPPVFDAVDMGDLDAVLACLQTTEVNTPYGEFGATVLYYAVSTSGILVSFPIMHALLDHGADPCIGLAAGGSVLHGFGFGSYQPHQVDDLEKVIRRCVTLGADLELHTGQLHWTPLHYALAELNRPVCKALLRVGADPNATVSTKAAGVTAGVTALGMAAGWPDMFALLLAYGADPHQPDGWGRSPKAMLEQRIAESSDAGHRAKYQACLQLLPG
ncbi:hypothetical protein [Yoonia sp. BS5-3]|uniref:Ankyrin repeat domain-containing protein n=1 Tax=Yoonia phaeophyticola TaxID=3137369 RepID=A0ABZ2V1W9_9RHOB